MRSPPTASTTRRWRSPSPATSFGAAAILEGDEEGPLHLNRAAIVAHAQVLAQIGREDDAVALLDEALAGGVPDAPIIALRDRLAAGEEVPFDQVTRPRDGAAEAFLTLADALNGEDSERVALVHARLAAHIRPDLAEAQLLAADLLEAQEQFELASAALSSIPETSPWYVSAQVRLADTQRAAGDADAGIATLTALAASNQDRIEVDSALGDALRDRRALPGGGGGLRQGHRQDRHAAPGALGALLHPRHRQRARRRLARRRGRLPQGARARARPAAGAELPRLLDGREAARTSTRRSA